MEYKKFKTNELLPVYIIQDEDAISSILHKKDLLSYIILHNIKVINDYIFKNRSLNDLVDFIE